MIEMMIQTCIQHHHTRDIHTDNGVVYISNHVYIYVYWMMPIMFSYLDYIWSLPTQEQIDLLPLVMTGACIWYPTKYNDSLSITEYLQRLPNASINTINQFLDNKGDWITFKADHSEYNPLIYMDFGKKEPPSWHHGYHGADPPWKLLGILMINFFKMVNIMTNLNKIIHLKRMILRL